MTSCGQKCSRRRVFVSIWFFGFAILVVGITVNVIVGNLLQDAIDRAVIFRNPDNKASTEKDKEAFSDWVSNAEADDAHLLYSFYMYDVVGEGAFQEVGPFVYQAHVTKYCVRFGNEDRELSYQEHVALTYRQDLSGTVPLGGGMKHFALSVDENGCVEETLQEQLPGSKLSERTVIAGIAPNHVEYLRRLPLGSAYGAACGIGARDLVQQYLPSDPNATQIEQQIAVGDGVLTLVNAYIRSNRRVSYQFPPESARAFGEFTLLLAQPLEGTHPDYGRAGFAGYDFLRLMINHKESVGLDPSLVPFIDAAPCASNCTRAGKLVTAFDIVDYYLESHKEAVLAIFDATGDITRLSQLARPQAATMFSSGRVAAKTVSDWLFESNRSLSSTPLCAHTDSLDNVRRFFAPNDSPQTMAFVHRDPRPAPGLRECPTPSPYDPHPFAVKIHTGKGDVARINDALEFQGLPFVPSKAWASEQSGVTDWSWCRENSRVRGKIIGRWPPGEQTTLGFTPSPAGTRTFKPLLWSETLLRSVSFEFLETASVRGVDSKRFRLSDSALRPNSSFDQYASGIGALPCSTRQRASFFDHDVFPRVFTKGRYLGLKSGGALTIPTLTGVSVSNPSDSDTLIDIEPLSGLAIAAAERILYSHVSPSSTSLSSGGVGETIPVVLEGVFPSPVRYINQTAKINPSLYASGELLPLYMLERKVELSADQAAKLKRDLYTPIAIKDTVFLVTVPLGGLMILFAVAGLVANGSRDRHAEYIGATSE